MQTTGAQQLKKPGRDSDRAAVNELALIDTLARLSKWFKKALDKDQKSEYARALQWIPAEALEDIAQDIIEDNAPTPARFPTISQIKTRWFDWLTAHPQKRAQHPKIDCPVCKSEFGLLHGLRERQGITYGVTARCAACENWLAHIARANAIVPLMYPEQMETLGYVLEYPAKAKARPQPIKQLTGQVGEHINPGKRQEYFDGRKKP